MAFYAPADGNSYFKITTYGPVSGSFRVQYSTLVGRTFILQRSSNMGPWTNFQTTKNGTPVSLTFPMTGTKQFFRVKVTE